MSCLHNIFSFLFFYKKVTFPRTTKSAVPINKNYISTPAAAAIFLR